MKYEKLIENVQGWAADKDFGDARAQLTKIMEELGETSAAFNKCNHNKLVDSIGDLQVTIINFATAAGIDYKDALETAWDVIKDRKGKTVNNIFIKEEDEKDMDDEDLESNVDDDWEDDWEDEWDE